MEKNNSIDIDKLIDDIDSELSENEDNGDDFLIFDNGLRTHF